MDYLLVGFEVILLPFQTVEGGGENKGLELVQRESGRKRRYGLE